MVRIGGSTEKGKHIKEMDYYTATGEFRVDKGGSQVLLNCLMYKMCYYRFGSVYTEQGELRRYFLISLQPETELFIDMNCMPFVTGWKVRATFWTNQRKD